MNDIFDLTYNEGCILIFIVGYGGVSGYWYVHEKEWIEAGEQWLSCAIERIIDGKIHEIDSVCKHNYIAPAVCQIIAFVISIPVVIGGWVLQLTEDNLVFWRIEFGKMTKQRVTYE